MMFIARLERIARDRGDAPAVVNKGRVALTYRALWEAACGVAHRLHAAGAGRESLVVLHLRKSPEYLVALVGTWIAGAAFLPLDPALPRARRAWIASDARPSFVLGAPVGAAVSVPLDGAAAPRPPPGRRNAGDLAYVIYTSGSTGQPKGVAVEHRGIVPMLSAQIRAFDLDSRSRALFHLPISFDAAISDLGTALLAGAALHLDPDAASIEELQRVLRRDRITHVDLPPAVLSLLEPDALPRSLRTIVIGGEPCDPATVRRFAGRVRLVNVYGPTEATICTSAGRCGTDWSRPLLGRPLPHVRYHVLDPNLEPVPEGTPGELCIEGPALARGYLRRPELESQRFVRWRSRRLYRTGDRVILEAGEWHFLGRFDRQLKVRGALVAPEEIEAALRTHPGVMEAAVVSERRGARDILAAFVTGRVRPEALRDHLRAQLPKALVPHAIEVLPELPRTASGKVELAALRHGPRASRTGDLRARAKRSAVASPRDPTEALLVSLWREHLDAPEAGASDDFFTLGGDSLLAMKLAVAARSRGLALTPQLLAAHATPRALARKLERSAGSTMSAATLSRRAREIAQTLPLPRVASTRGTAPKRAAFLVTGATGFLGARLVRELLSRADAKIHCLVRAADAHGATQRLGSALRAHPEPLDPSWRDRLVAHPGDVAEPRLGLDAKTYRRLADEVSDLFHCAAQVNVVLPFPSLEPANLTGTAEALRLARAGHPKALHYASTLSVFVSTDRGIGVCEESDRLERTRTVYGGYAQTKLAAELLARRSGHAPLGVYRFGLLTGDSCTGASPERDWLRLFIRGIARVGCIPASAPLGAAFDVTPVDYAAAAMAVLSLGRGAEGGTFHVAGHHPATLGQLLTAMRAEGVAVRRVPDRVWRARLTEAIEAGSTDALVAHLALAHALEPGDESLRESDLFLATSATFSSTNTRAGLRGSGISPPPPNRALLARYVRATLTPRPPA